MPTNKVAKDDTLQDLVTAVENIATIMGSGVIDDTTTASDKAWSSSKVSTELSGKQASLTWNGNYLTL